MTTHLKSFDLVGKVEDVSDVISMLDPTDTPFLSSIASESIHNVDHKWLEDQLRAPRKNVAAEGADAVDSVRDQPSWRENHCQILEETFRVSGTSQAVKLYGRKGAVDRETLKTGKLLKQDLEYSLVGTGQTMVVRDGTDNGEFAGVQAQISTDTTTNAAGPMSEDAIVDTHEKLYNAGADASTLMVYPSDTKVIAAFATAVNRARDLSGDTKKITNVINVYESPFGTVRVVKNRHIRSTDALLYDAKNWKLLTLRPWQREKLAKTGDSDRWQMLGEFSLKHVNQKASGLITGLTR